MLQVLSTLLMSKIQYNSMRERVNQLEPISGGKSLYGSFVFYDFVCLFVCQRIEDKCAHGSQPAGQKHKGSMD